MVVANHLLITGPSRGGKSEWAEQRIRKLAASEGITYLAPAQPFPMMPLGNSDSSATENGGLSTGACWKPHPSQQ